MRDVRLRKRSRYIKINNQHMDNPAMPKGQRVTTPEGSGDVIETFGEKVVVKLDSGATNTFQMDEVEDDSSAG